jgi:hypothetical protein
MSDLAKGRARHGEAGEFFRDTVLAYGEDDCLIWPYSRNGEGYGRLWHKGRPRSVHRIVCEAIHGPAPTSKHEAAHSCGRGHDGCVAPNHLSWKTPAENHADMVDHGTAPRGEASPNVKLTEANVRKIRLLKGRKSKASIAREFGVSRRLIQHIYSGNSWGWLA